MKYKVLKYFEDLQDDRYPYHEGDIFPRDGFDVSEERIAELSSDANRRGKPLIEKVDDDDTEKVVVKKRRSKKKNDDVE